MMFQECEEIDCPNVVYVIQFRVTHFMNPFWHNVDPSVQSYYAGVPKQVCFAKLQMPNEIVNNRSPER